MGKPKTEEHKRKISEALKGRKRTPEQCANISRALKASPNNKGDKHARWKGDQAAYVTIHIWAKNHFEKLGVCENCGAEGRTEWSNIDHCYSRDRRDWQELCARCHKAHDYELRGCHPNQVR